MGWCEEKVCEGLVSSETPRSTRCCSERQHPSLQLLLYDQSPLEHTETSGVAL